MNKSSSNDFLDRIEFFPRSNVEKFHFQNAVRLEDGRTKNIQQITLNDFLRSVQLNQNYSSLHARFDSIGAFDHFTGRVELRFYVPNIAKTVSLFVVKETPFFVFQHSSWASICPDATRRICGLHCRHLTCGDYVLILIDRQNQSEATFNFNKRIKLFR